MPNCTPSVIASQSRKPRRRTATPMVPLNRARPNMGHTWTPNCPIYLLPIPCCRVSSLLLLWIALFPLALHADENGTNKALLKSFTFYASFNRGIDADFAHGDPNLYTIVSGKPDFKTAVGLRAEGMTKLIKGKGLSGDALQFTRRDAKKLFYKAKKNLAYGRREWSGTVSLWLRLDPEKDLDPGYCDPIQITPRQWNDGAFFVDFDRAGDP